MTTLAQFAGWCGVHRNPLVSAILEEAESLEWLHNAYFDREARERLNSREARLMVEDWLDRHPGASVPSFVEDQLFKHFETYCVAYQQCGFRSQARLWEGV